MKNFARSGGCVCGKTRYALTAEPALVYACHCTDCQTRTGAAFGLSAIVAAGAFELLSGALDTWRRIGSNGTYVWERCAECGTNLFSSIEGAADVLAVWPGTLDDTSWVKPEAHLWTSSAQPWIRFTEADVTYATQPDDLSEIYSV